MKKDVVSIWKTWRHISKNKWKDIARLLGWFILQWKYFGGKISGSLVYIGDSTGRCFLYLPSLLLYSTVKGCVTAGGEGRCSVSANRGEVFFFLTFWWHQMVREVRGWWEMFSAACVSVSAPSEKPSESGVLWKKWIRSENPQNLLHNNNNNKKAIPFTRLKNVKHWTFNFLQLR